jgi:hypothetical protein
MKLGLKPFVHDSRDLLFSRYRTGAPLPKHPAHFGHENLVQQWDMLGNDQYGDCVWAGAAHETMLWNAMAQRTVTFTTEGVLSDYAACTGFDPHDPATDQGTDMRAAMKYRQKTGIVDAEGNRHKIGAYAWIQPGNYDHFLEAVWLFGACPIGIQVPQSAMDQFNGNKPWSVVSGSPIEGGHYIPGVADRTYPEIVTWARVQPMTRAFYLKYCDAACAVISEEMLSHGKSPEGFDLAALQADLKALG